MAEGNGSVAAAAGPGAGTGGTAARTRVLVAVPVYGGHDHLDACLSSVARLVTATAEVDVLVLDDGSPEVAFGAQLEALCAAHGLAHYRSPRNQGIPRTFNLAIRRAQTGGYQYVVLVNSDVVAPPAFVDHLLDAAAEGARTLGGPIATVTAWSNQASAFSIEVAHRDEQLAGAVNVERAARWLHERFGGGTIELPTGAGHCMMLSVAAVEQVGLMDPVFGRGYCEELDWCQRARAAGFHNVLALGSFVWHRGSATSSAVGMLGPTETSVPHNEKIIDARYPAFRHDVGMFFYRGLFERASTDARQAIVAAAASEVGWVLQVSATERAPRRDDVVVVRIDPSNASAPLAATWLGIAATLPVLGDDPIASAAASFGRPPSAVMVLDNGHVAELARLHGDATGVAVTVHRPYPSRVI